MQAVSNSLYDYDVLFKVLLIGESGVGKSCICTHYLDQKFCEDSQPTVGIDFKTKNLEIQGEKIKLMLYDSSGHERYHNICSMYYQSSQAIIFIYDVSNRESYAKLWTRMKEAESAIGSNITKVLIGNKSDLNEKREVSYEEGKALARKIRMKFFETSAVNGKNIAECLKFVVDELLDERDNKIYADMISKRDKMMRKHEKKKEGFGKLCCCVSERN